MSQSLLRELDAKVLGRRTALLSLTVVTLVEIESGGAAPFQQVHKPHFEPTEKFDNNQRLKRVRQGTQRSVV